MAGVPRDARVPLPARVLGVHVPCADCGGKQEPPDPHGSDDRAEWKEKPAKKGKTFASVPCRGTWTHLGGMLKLVADQAAYIRRTLSLGGTRVIGTPFKGEQARRKPSSKSGHFQLSFHFGQTTFLEP